MMSSGVLMLVNFIFLLSSHGIHPTFNTTNVKSVVATSNVKPGEEPKNHVVLRMRFFSSKHSPVFKPNTSFEHRVASEMNMSLHRIAYLEEKRIIASNFSSSKFTTQPDVTGMMSHGTSLSYLVMLCIGFEPDTQFLALDTGSSFVWVHCKPCQNLCGGSSRVEVTTYDPKLTDYNPNVPCDDHYCEYPGRLFTECNYDKNQCMYEIGYASGYSSGRMLVDTFFTSSGTNLGDFYFGCSDLACFPRNDEHFAKINGIFGVGTNKLSFMSQLSLQAYERQFSYCFERFPVDEYDVPVDNWKTDSTLVLGEPLMENGNWTPMYVDRGHYYVSIQEIWIGDKKLDAPIREIRRFPDNRGGALIDTGSTLNVLQSGTFKAFMDEINRLMSKREALGPTDDGRPCYGGYVESLRNFPLVRFVFVGRFCLNFKDGGSGFSSALLGASLQQSMYVNYDVKKKRIYFQEANCTSTIIDT
ncbi:hypothetical protein DM860_013231 [Cuscuta australis]|uniref:Peptidase A1 domain-containing protein n=1 Tax=Cuscuta australis TaxID=267555 RepID=A0A328DP73_9ASTE|nr:hypothetical protein DM860_013231 [Cuscuta australis]